MIWANLPERDKMKGHGVEFEVVIEGNISPEDIPADTLALILKQIQKLAGTEIYLVGVEKKEPESLA